MNIDDIVDRKTGQKSPGERFHDDWLSKLPRGQWPSYIDESAQLVADGIYIGDTDLMKADFGSETGEYYRKGLAESAGIDPDSTSLPLGNHSARDIGLIAWVFNRLREEIRQSEYTDFENPSRAIEAAVNKALVESIEEGTISSNEMETIRLPESATVSTLVSEVFCRPRSEAYIDLLLETVRNTKTTSLLAHLDEPRMVTPLWDHQRNALDRWIASGCRGYVDMATATGKTVLGLAAIAHHFGALHPHDRGLTDDRVQPALNGRATVLVVAHRDLILDQWKREFDTHLNIPEKSSTQKGEHTVEFEWGDIHFWTPNRLKQAGVPDADLVVLDETHHYLGSSGFGSILDDIDGHLLALSGSLDEANAKSLERRDVPEIFEFTLQDGQEAGIIPQCDWDVVFTPYEEQSQLAEISSRCRAGMKQYKSGIEPPSGTDVSEADLSFETLSEARSIAQSTTGRQLKEADPDFREFASAVMGRQLTMYNLSPVLSTVAGLVLDRIDQHKCVVLLETGDEIDWVTDELQTELGEGYDQLVTVLDGDSDLRAVEEFDRDQECGAIIGMARTLGEGIDIETADVCINRGRGRLSRSLVQRMGRILRNPDGEKHAHFFHVTGIPTQEKAQLPREDGVTLLETASQLLSWGQNFQARPVFEVDSRSTLREQDLVDLEQAGAAAIDDWSPEHYDFPKDTDVKAHLEELCRKIPSANGSALLAIERPERDDIEERDEEISTGPAPDADRHSVEFVAADGGGIPVHNWLITMAEAASERDEDLQRYIERTVRRYAQQSLTFPDADLAPDNDAAVTVAINPALDAVLRAYTSSESTAAAVNAALVSAIADRAEQLLERSGTEIEVAEVNQYLTAIGEEPINE